MIGTKFIQIRGLNKRFQLMINGKPVGPWQNSRKELKKWAKNNGHELPKRSRKKSKDPQPFGDYRDLQQAVKVYKEAGKTNIALNSSQEALQAELKRLKK